jgi:ribulose-5-phosphate 4-epimerase/fuculose-1-phosphate aldolase
VNRSDILSALCDHARSLFARGFTVGSGGNLSHRLGDGFLMEASGTSFGRLAPEHFVLCDAGGAPVESGPPPSKEVGLHAAIYRRCPDAKAVVHLHSAGAIALSCTADPTDTGSALPLCSVYAALRVGRVPLLEFIPPGSQALADRAGQVCAGLNAILLANHGQVAWAATLDAAVDVAEELEQTARIWVMTGGAARTLGAAELAALARP